MPRGGTEAASPVYTGGMKPMMRCFSLLLVLLLGASGVFSPPANRGSCPLPGQRSGNDCAFCATTTNGPSAGPTLQSGCCRYQPGGESNSAQAASIGAHPKPHQSPEPVAALPGHAIGTVSRPGPWYLFRTSGDSAPPGNPTRTTHLLL
jgi:hypothetical protein